MHLAFGYSLIFSNFFDRWSSTGGLFFGGSRDGCLDTIGQAVH